MEQMNSDRLKRWKCLQCGCNDKNIVNLQNPDYDEPSIKIVTCENCGHTDFFGISALAFAQILTGQQIDVEKCIQYKRDFHMKNHNLPSASKPYHSKK